MMESILCPLSQICQKASRQPDLSSRSGKNSEGNQNIVHHRSGRFTRERHYHHKHEGYHDDCSRRGFRNSQYLHDRHQSALRPWVIRNNDGKLGNVRNGTHHHGGGYYGGHHGHHGGGHWHGCGCCVIMADITKT